MPCALQELGLFFLFVSFSPSLSDPVYMALGEDAVLRPPPTDLPIKIVTWKHNEDIAADWYGEYECFGQFKGRCEVNTDSGALTIKGLTLNDSGIYTPEINGRVLNPTELSVISRVAKPSVETSCKSEITFCLLTCEGNTSNAELISFKWFVDGRDGPSGNLLILTEDTKGDSFSCLMMNPVSNETSESVTNPFIKQVYRAKGEDMILRPPSMTETIQSIEWKHNENIAAEWYGDEFECLGQFEGRCEVNTNTGALTIKGLKLNDNGNYTPEINGKDCSKTQLSVISHVAKPSVKTFCNTEMTSCLLTCEGNTAEAEPITYMWFIDGKDGPSNDVLIIKEDTKENSFSCLMMNPVSDETSESIRNPIIIKRKQDQLISILVPVIAVIVLVVIVVAAFIYRERRRRAMIGMWLTEHKDTIKHIRELYDTMEQAKKLRELEDTSEEERRVEMWLRKKEEIWQRKLYDTLEKERHVEMWLKKEDENWQRILDDTIKDEGCVEMWLKEQGGSAEEIVPLSPSDTPQHLSDGAETESVTPETSNNSPAGAEVSNTNLETVL